MFQILFDKNDFYLNIKHQEHHILTSERMDYLHLRLVLEEGLSAVLVLA